MIRGIWRTGAAVVLGVTLTGHALALEVGDSVSGEATLIQRQIPLPAGDWTVAGLGTNTLISGNPGAYGTIENAILVRQDETGLVDAVVELNVNRLGVQGGWGVAGACDGKVSLSTVAFYRTGVDGFCLFVKPTDLGATNAAGPRAWADAQSLVHSGVSAPSRTWLTVGFRVSDRSDMLDVRYHFDPKALGLKPVPGAAWTLDAVLKAPDRYAALNQLNAWGALSAGLVEDGFRGSLAGRTAEAPLPNPWDVEAVEIKQVEPGSDGKAPAAAPIGQVSPSARVKALDDLLAAGAITAEDHAAYLKEIAGDETAPEAEEDYYRLLFAKVISFNFFRVSVDYLLAFIVTVNAAVSGLITAAIVVTHSVVQVFNDMWWDNYILSAANSSGNTVDFVYIGSGTGAGS